MFLLTAEEEEIVVGFILGLDMTSVPLTNDKIQAAFHKVSGQAVSKPWVTGLNARHSDRLASGAVKGIETRRLKTSSPEEVEDWLQRFEKFLETHHFPAHARLNVDETRLVPKQNKIRVVGTKRAKTNNKKNNNRESRTKSLVTYLPFGHSAISSEFWFESMPICASRLRFIGTRTVS